MSESTSNAAKRVDPAHDHAKSEVICEQKFDMPSINRFQDILLILTCTEASFK